MEGINDDQIKFLHLSGELCWLQDEILYLLCYLKDKIKMRLCW